MAPVGFWDRFRGKKSGAKDSGAGAAARTVAKVRWLSPEESAFGVRTLDLRPATQGMVSMTKDPANAKRATSWTLATAQAIPSVEPGVGFETSRCALSYAVAPGFPDGLLFAPRAMEEKWALFHQSGSIIAVRSWTGKVAAVARGTRGGDRLVLQELVVNEGGLGPFADQPAIFDWLLRTHALGETLPLPVSDAGLDLLARAPLMVFSLFGQVAQFAASGFSAPEPTGPLRVFGPIVQAVRGGDAARVRALLTEGADPDVPSPLAGYTALHLAMSSSEVESMRALLAGGANPNVRTDRGMDPIGLGIVQGAPPAILEELIAAGGGLGGINDDGFGLLHAAAETNRPEIIRWLADRGLDVNALTGRGLTPLHIACGLGHVEAARALIAAGADTTANSSFGTPREIAEREGHPAVAALIGVPGPPSAR